MKSFSIDPVNGLCGALLAFVGVFFLVQAANLEIGTAFRMGPGYFPLVLSIILLGLGIAIFVSALRSNEGDSFGPIAWRGMLFILVSPILFGMMLRPLGFVPAIFLTSFVASFASSRMRLHYAVLIAGLLALFTTLVFVRALGLPFRLFGPWLGA